jgi:hypothetical protein
MPSERIAKHIAEALAEGERQEDFEYMVDALSQMRRPYHPQTQYEEVVEYGAAKILCIIVPIKPLDYVKTTQRFRILFYGIADSTELQAVFANSVLPAALTVGEQVQYLPSRYFSWHPILRLHNLQGADLQEAIQEANLQGADLQEANLQGADLQGADLQGAFLFRTNLRGADLQEAFLRTAILRAASLQEVRELTQEQLEQAVH